MKTTTKILSIILAISLLLAIPVSANEVSTRASSFFVCTCTYLHQTDTNKFEVWFEVMATAEMDELGVSTIEIQRSKDGNTWTTMRVMSSSVYPKMLDTDTMFYTNGIPYTGTAGYYYKAYVTYYAKDGNNVGKFDTCTDAIKL